MPKNTAECGKRDERELVKDLIGRGYSARRQPGSGNVDPTLPHDVVWEDSPIGKLLIECKWRATCGWRTLLTWMEGAPILTVKCDGRRGQDSERYVFMKWETFMELVGDAAARSEHIADLPSTEPDKPWLTEHLGGSWLNSGIEAVAQERQRRETIQAAHVNPPKRNAKPNKLQGRRFRK